MSQLKWWQKAVFYQIYPRSFADANHDGMSDFPGMTAKLDYLQDLGVDAIWLSPHFPSPFLDCGYDISDFTGVAPEYGTLDDFKRFLDAAHQRGLRVILDLVLNHTSHLHPWFIESRSSPVNPRRDWYVWRDGAPDGQPPNDWNSLFGGSAWEFDALSGQWYYHMFLKEQPDLNWKNPEVKQAMFDAARFWLDMGVDGFRLDAVITLYEHPNLPNHSVTMSHAEIIRRLQKAKTPQELKAARKLVGQMFRYQLDHPDNHAVLKELRELVDRYPDRVLVGETDDIAFHGDNDDELHLVFNFPMMRTNRLTPSWARANQRQRLAELPSFAWPCNTLGNHDTSRLISHFGDGLHDLEIARFALALMLTLRGTPFLYYGEEIGMTDLILTDFSQVRDMLVRWQYDYDRQVLGISEEEATSRALQRTRDRCRTPMQWANAPNAGFSPKGIQPWLPVNPNYASGVNVADQLSNPGSLLHFYRKMLRVRRATPALVAGDYTPLHEDAQDYFAFLRSSPQDGQSCLVVLNSSANTLDLAFDLPAVQLRLVFSSHERSEKPESPGALRVAPFEIYIAELV